jgi:hypothetical protein
MDPTALVLVDRLMSGSVQYLRQDLFPRRAIYSSAHDWMSQRPQANVVLLPEYTFTSPQDTRYLTAEEQQIFGTALRRSVRILRKASRV